MWRKSLLLCAIFAPTFFCSHQHLSATTTTRERTPSCACILQSGLSKIEIEAFGQNFLPTVPSGFSPICRPANLSQIFMWMCRHIFETKLQSYYAHASQVLCLEPLKIRVSRKHRFPVPNFEYPRHEHGIWRKMLYSTPRAFYVRNCLGWGV